MEKKIKFNRWFGLLGLLGFLAFIPKHNGDPNWFFLMFFGFFSAFLWEPIENELVDERLIENKNKAQNIISIYYIMISFIILFLIDRDVEKNSILLVGTVLYTLGFYIKPLLIRKFERE